MGKRSRKTRCWACSSLAVIKWGKQFNKQRFHCKTCGIFFTSENNGVKQSNELIWFKRWVLNRCTYKELSQESGYSERTLKYKFEVYLNHYPQWRIPNYRVVNLVLDGTYFSNKICLFIYRENQLKETLLYRSTKGEYSEEIYEDLINIMNLGIVIESITCDGHKSILKAINQANKWLIRYNKSNNTEVKLIVIQRCMVHIQRTCLKYIKQDHLSVTGHRLRAIAMTLCKIKTLEHKILFIDAFNFWFEENKQYIMQLSYSQANNKWRTHKSLYSAYMSIKRALPNMFNYIDNSNIPNTTNSLEGFFSHLKVDIAVHRGLSNQHFRSVLKWYLYFKNQNQK